jgi:hypothetical protein
MQYHPVIPTISGSFGSRLRICPHQVFYIPVRGSVFNLSQAVKSFPVDFRESSVSGICPAESQLAPSLLSYTTIFAMPQCLKAIKMARSRWRSLHRPWESQFLGEYINYTLSCFCWSKHREMAMESIYWSGCFIPGWLFKRQIHPPFVLQVMTGVNFARFFFTFVQVQSVVLLLSSPKVGPAWGMDLLAMFRFYSWCMRTKSISGRGG